VFFQKEKFEKKAEKDSIVRPEIEISQESFEDLNESIENEKQKPHEVAYEESMSAHSSLRNAIAYIPDTTDYFSKERERIYRIFGLQVDSDGNPLCVSKGVEGQ
jgi:hypothetical protein